MTQKLFAHKGKIMRRLSILLSFLLLCNCVISSNVTTQAESEVTVETTETTETSGTDTTDTTVILSGEDDLTTEPDADEPTDDTLTESVADGVIRTGTYGDITVTVEAAEDAFTEEVSVSVSAADEEAFEAAVLEACTDNYPADTYTVIDVAAVNISFLSASGSEVEPASEVKVTISGLELATESIDEDETTHTANYALIFHMDDEGNMEWIDEKEAGQESYEFMASEFSDYGIATVEVTYTEEEEKKDNPPEEEEEKKDNPPEEEEKKDNPPEQGGDSGNQECDPSYYKSSSYVFYDTFSPDYTNGVIIGGSVDTNARSHIESVSLNSISVVQRDSSTTSWETDGASTLSTYFPEAYYTDANDYKEQTVSLTITPDTGYYITAIVVACTSQGDSTPYNCNTMEAAEAFNTTISVGTNGAVTVSVTSTDFSHRSESPYYFILIAVSPIPSPLYVEYDYGNIVDIIGEGSASSAFSAAAGWTTTSDGNYYGNGISDDNVDKNYENGGYTGYGVMTDDTQYKYAYTEGNSDEAANWKHYANSITDDAKAQAAAAGYVFVGWKAEYYTSVTVTDQTADEDGYQYDYNNWNYDFDDDSYYGGGTIYAEGASVTLTTNVRLIAQWVPIGIQIEKAVEGLPDGATSTYTIELQKLDGSSWTTVDSAYTASVTGSGTSKNNTVYLIASGTYQVAETNAPSTVAYNGTTYYLASTSGESIDVSVPTSSDYTIKTVEINGIDTEVAVLNNVLTYTNVYSTSYIKVVKVFKGLDSSSDIPGDFSVTVGSYTLTKSGDYFVGESVDSSGIITWTWTIPGADTGNYTVSESNANIDGYTLSSTAGTGTVAVSAVGDTITVTNTYQKDVTITITKTVAGNMGDTTKEFDFTLTLNSYTADLSATKTSSDSSATAETLTYDSLDGNYSFTLSHNESITITVPYGSVYTVSEDASDYTMTVDAAQTGTATGDVKINYTNTYNVTPDTGIALDSAPYLLMLAGVFALGGGMLIRRRRRRW